MADFIVPQPAPHYALIQQERTHLIGVRFMRVGKIYHFTTAGYEVRPGDRVIVETTRGRQLGEVVNYVDPAKTPAESVPPGGYKRIEGLATSRDLALEQYWKSKETEAMINARERAHQLRLHDIKVVKAEYAYDGARLTFLLSGPDEGGGKLETKSLRDDMQAQYPDTQVALRQIGPRDVAKLIGGLGACGLETRCCSMFLTEFSPVSIKMAKEQGLSLNPEEITGMCGRLRCCLVYEYDQYTEARKQLPKIKKRVLTPKGPGKVTDVNPLKQTVFVAVALNEMDTRVFEFHKDELQPADELEALQKKATAPCDRHANGGCNCGKAKK